MSALGNRAGSRPNSCEGLFVPQKEMTFHSVAACTVLLSGHSADMFPSCSATEIFIILINLTT